MRRRVSVALLSGCVLLVAAAAAQALGVQELDNQYEGRAERDVSTYVGFDIVKQGKVRKIKGVQTYLPYNCDGGNGGPTYAGSPDKLRVRKDKTFAGTLNVPVDSRGGAASQWKIKLRGKLGKQGKARGTVDASFRYKAGDDFVRCTTSGLDWKAERGADVEPQFRGRK